MKNEIWTAFECLDPRCPVQVFEVRSIERILNSFCPGCSTQLVSGPFDWWPADEGGYGSSADGKSTRLMLLEVLLRVARENQGTPLATWALTELTQLGHDTFESAQSEVLRRSRGCP